MSALLVSIEQMTRRRGPSTSSSRASSSTAGDAAGTTGTMNVDYPEGHHRHRATLMGKHPLTRCTQRLLSSSARTSRCSRCGTSGMAKARCMSWTQLSAEQVQSHTPSMSTTQPCSVDVILFIPVVECTGIRGGRWRGRRVYDHRLARPLAHSMAAPYTKAPHSVECCIAWATIPLAMRRAIRTGAAWDEI